MRIRYVASSIAAVAAATSAFAVSTPALAGDPIMPLTEVRAGMSCTSLSVIQGTEPTHFNVEIIDVIGINDISTNQLPGSAMILAKFSGPAVDATGIGPGFSGSPIYCPDSAGTYRVVGAISLGIGEYGNKLGLATPIEAMLANDVLPPASTQKPATDRKSSKSHKEQAKQHSKAKGSSAKKTPSKPSPKSNVSDRSKVSKVVRSHGKVIGPIRPLATPLTISGLSQPIAHNLTLSAQRKGLMINSPVAGTKDFPVQTLRPGSAAGISLVSGDISAGTIGTVSYVDGQRVWILGHLMDGAGKRSLPLTDAYIYRVISNPNVSPLTGQTTKIGVVGHMVGTLSNDTNLAAVGSTGAIPTTIPVRIISRDQDSGKRSVLKVQVADETDLNNPTGSKLAGIAPLLLMQAAATTLNSISAPQTVSMCARISVKEHDKPLRFCNSYLTPPNKPSSDQDDVDMEHGGSMSKMLGGIATRGAKDLAKGIDLVNLYKAKALHVTGIEVNMKLHRGANHATIESVSLPREVRPGQQVRAKMVLQHRNRKEKVTFKVRVPQELASGTRQIVFKATDQAGSEGDPFDQIAAALAGGGPGADKKKDGHGQDGPVTIEALAEKVKKITRHEGVHLAQSEEKPVDATQKDGLIYTRSDVAISGSATATVKVVAKKKR